MVATAALLFAGLAAIVCVFQIALVLGAPWGELTLAGRWRGPLPGYARLIPLVSALLVAAFAAVIVARAQLAFAPLQPWAPALAWFVVGYFVLGCIANAATPSRRERNLWLPVVLSMLVLSGIVAAS